MLSNIPKLLTFLVFLLNSGIQAQEIWRESFPIPGKGIRGDENGTIQADFSGITSWYLDYSNVSVANADDYAQTVETSGGRFEVRDIEGEVIWYSEKIEVSEFENVRIQLFAQETGSGSNGETKYLKAFYRLDDGQETLFEINGENSGNWGTGTVSQSILNGKILQVVVYMANSYSSDKVILDEIVVSGEEKNIEPVLPGELVINEILFNPFPGGADYVEIYNNSEKAIGLNRLFLASRNNDMELVQIYPLSSTREKLAPASYLALTKDTSGVFPFYSIRCPECFLQMNKFPSFNDDEDYVVLLDENLQVIDEFHYTAKMHSPLLVVEEGVSLERVSFTEATGNPANWHSASTASGYGTPGYENSQATATEVSAPVITISPDAFSPNSDGYNDELKIAYELDKPGYMATVRIFDANGIPVLTVANNEIAGMHGEFAWDGKDETGHRQNMGVYIVLVEIFNADGTVHRIKKGVVLTDILE